MLIFRRITLSLQTCLMKNCRLPFYKNGKRFPTTFQHQMRIKCQRSIFGFIMSGWQRRPAYINVYISVYFCLGGIPIPFKSNKSEVNSRNKWISYLRPYLKYFGVQILVDGTRSRQAAEMIKRMNNAIMDRGPVLITTELISSGNV